jgi:hypothetical protein
LDSVLRIPVISIDNGSREALLKRARSLATDPGYPPPFVIEAVADLIARHVRV